MTNTLILLKRRKNNDLKLSLINYATHELKVQIWFINRSIAPSFKAGVEKLAKPPSSKFGRSYKLINNTFQILRKGKLAKIVPHPEGQGY